MRWIGSLVAEALRIRRMAGCFSTPPMRVQAITKEGCAFCTRRTRWRWNRRQRRRHQRATPHLELGAMTPHQRVPLIMGSVRGVRDVTAIHEGIEPMFTRVTRRCSHGVACFASWIGPRRATHPIISITGTSAPVRRRSRRRSRNIFRREKVAAAYIEGDAFHRYNCAQMRTKTTAEDERGDRTSAGSAPKPVCSRSWRRRFATMVNRHRHHPALCPRR